MIDLRTVISDQEKIIWEGKPDKKCFILESIFNPMLPFAIIWACVDIFAIGAFTSEDGGFFIIPFMLLHMMPVWIYLGGVILSVRRYHNTYYIITDAGVYISGGAFSYSYNMKPWAELSNISLHRGIFDQYIGVGDVIFEPNIMMMMANSSNSNNNTSAFAIINIKDYQEVYKLVKDLQRDIHADTMYPNDLRPKENHGYNTDYRR